jgi:hypothetical protein
MSLSQNQFTISTLQGTKVQGEAILNAEFYSATPADVMLAGFPVELAHTTNGYVSKVQAGSSSVSSAWLGVVLTNPLADSHAVGQKVEVALNQCVVMMTASAAFYAGTALEVDPVTAKVYTKSAGTQIGVALEDASAANDLVRVLIKIA